MNQAAFDALTHEGFANNQFSDVLYLFDGTYNFDSIIMDDQNTIGGWYDIKKITDAIEAQGSSIKGGMYFETTLHARRPNENTIVFPLSESTSELKQYSEGAVTWFMFIPSLVAINDGVLDSKAVKGSQVLVGSVGDIGSGADLEIPGATLSSSKDYKATDLVLTLA